MFHPGQVEFEILNSHVKISSGHRGTPVHNWEVDTDLGTSSI